jgi:hypothetical protein
LPIWQNKTKQDKCINYKPLNDKRNINATWMKEQILKKNFVLVSLTDTR